VSADPIAGRVRVRVGERARNPSGAAAAFRRSRKPAVYINLTKNLRRI